MAATSLQQKIREVEEEHAERQVESHLEKHDQVRRDQAMQFLGGAIAIDRLKNHLASQVITALMTIEEQKLYLDYGFDRFADFLDRSDISMMSKSQFYKLRDLYLKEGPEKYDYFTEWGIPLSTRKLLSGGSFDVQIDGDEIVIEGKERIPISESRAITSIIKRLVQDNIGVVADKTALEEKLEKQKEQLKRGNDENEELRRNLDGMNETSRIQRAYLHAINALLLLAEAVGELDDDEKAERGSEDLRQIVIQYHQLSDAYGVKQPIDRQSIELQQKVATMKPVEEMTEAEKKATFADRAIAAIGLDDLD